MMSSVRRGLAVAMAVTTVLAAATAGAQTTMPSAPAAAAAGSTPPGAAVGRGSRVLVISIDGARPDVALRADMPNLRQLLKAGSFTMWARTTDVAITLPSHTSMVTGVVPEKHKITWNDDAGEDKFRYPAYPTLMDLAKKAGYTTAIVTSKSKFVALSEPGTIDWAGIPDKGKGSKADATAQVARGIIESHKPQVMLLHFADPDNAGHAIGWGTPEQIEALEKVDAGLGVVVKALKDAGVYDDTLIIVSADHGGMGKTHGANDLRAAFIPWIAVGPGVRKNLDLTRFRDVTVRTEDTFATAAAFLGLKVARDIEGKPVKAIWQVDELMQDAPATPKPKQK